MGAAKRLSAAALTLLGSALLVELSLRAFVPRPEYFDHHPFDPELGFASIPRQNHRCCDGQGPFPWVLNADGFRGPDLPAADAPAPSGTTRLLFVGDSFLEAWNVREEAMLPFSARAELARRGVSAESYSLSSSGHGTAQELLALRRYGERVQPDVVVLCLYSGNDVIDNSLDLAGRTMVSTGAWVRPYFVLDEAGELELTWLHPWRARLRSLSHAFTLFDQRYYAWRYRARGQYLREDPEHPVDPNQRLAKGLVMGADMELFLEPAPGSAWERAWQTSEALLLAFERETRALGARLLVVVIPHVVQVELNAQFRQTEYNMLRAGLPSMLTQLDLNLPEQRLGAFFERHGIEALFLLDHLRTATRAEGASYYLYDGHLDSRGHALAGARTGTRLAELLTGPEGAQEAAAGDGAPIDILAELWRTRTELRFGEPFDELLAYGWVAWGCDQFGLGPGWAMKQEGWIALRRGQRYVLEGALPPTARFPVTIQVKNHHRLRAKPLVVSAPGSFEIVVDVNLDREGPEWMPLVVSASQAFPNPGTAPIGMILKAVRRVD